MSEIEVRLAHADEYARIDEAIVEAYAHDYGPNDHPDPNREARVRAQHYDVWVAAEGARVLGSVTSRRIDGPSLHEGVPENDIDVRLLGVSPSARRRGIGALLMRRVIEHARDAGAVAVSLKTQPFMVGAHRLYEGLGFERRPERDGLWFGDTKVLDLHAYVLPLGPLDAAAAAAADDEM
ncbi:GNAT family N-acetyltransferase [Leucobacter triazinivorans]|uniref:GNAT family N-acetyltransferase n=1 Tax=Leucobacter triazinivorans TaxID=1784719 RepID=A0A4V0Z1H6_9MICO|nr:GNAT family N-acetyltransferase [Leucobacter triazinivorans]QBE48439.1 GNAT family N-acetyltransferase [Leucobacter triazinivorans]